MAEPLELFREAAIRHRGRRCRGLLAALARRETELRVKRAAEMRQVVETPGKSDLADLHARPRPVGEVATAVVEPIDEDVATKRNVVVRQQRIHVTRRNT